MTINGCEFDKPCSGDPATTATRTRATWSSSATTRTTSAALLLVALVSSVLSGCHKEVGVPVASLPRLSRPAQGAPEVQLRGDDGSTVDIDDDLDVVLVLHGGREFRFDHPVTVVMRDGDYLVGGSNRPSVRFEAKEIARVYLPKPDVVSTVTVSVLGGIVAYAATFVLFAVLAKPHGSAK
jgi:hypothetical protein